MVLPPLRFRLQATPRADPLRTSMLYVSACCKDRIRKRRQSMATILRVLSLCPTITLCKMLIQHLTYAPSLPRNAGAVLVLCESYKSKLEAPMGHLTTEDNEKAR